ncbi:hypothetical protein Tco_1132954 [Tanacetum coccineum]|uniref:Uncharacterized protein n=1 Tax=Tanacetum coccineum TaxID=301880 RepID=A0ABQ5JG93_9ASTR
MPAASHPPKRLRADYGTTGGSATGGKSPSVLNRLLQDSRLMVEQGVPALPTLPFITLLPVTVHFGGWAGRPHYSCWSFFAGAKSADPEVDSLVRSAALVMTEATTVATVATTVAILADVSKDKSAPHPSIFGSSSSSEKTDRTFSLFTGRSGSGFAAGSIRTEEVIGAGLEEIYVPEWIYNILKKRKWRSLAEEKYCLLGAKDKEIEDLKSQLLKANEESMEVSRLCARVSNLEATEGSLRGEVTSAKEYNGLLEQECDSLKLKVTSLESTIAEKDRELYDLGASSSSLKSQNQSLVNQVHELETSSTDLREKLEMYEGSLKRLEEFQDNLMRPLKTRLAEIDADFTRCCMRFQESFHPHLLNVVYMEALGHAFSRAIEKGMQEGLAAGIEHGQAGRCLTDLEAYIPSAEFDFNSAVRDLRDLNFPLLQELSNKKDASTQLMVPVHHKQDRVVIGSQALSVALDICREGWRRWKEILLCYLWCYLPVVIVPHYDPSVSVEDYDNPDLVDVVPKNVTSGPEGEEKIDASTRGDLAFSKLDDEARDAVL